MPEISFEGLDEALAQIKKLAKDLPAETLKGMMKTGLRIAGAAKVMLKTPIGEEEHGRVDTGNLMSSIRATKDPKTMTVTVSAGEGPTEGETSGGEERADVQYAVYVEYGTGIYAEEGNGRQTGWIYPDRKGELHFTRGMHPHPFMRPAAEQEGPKLYDDVVAAINARMEKK
jgi:HK97 gp10 family phage protein